MGTRFCMYCGRQLAEGEVCSCPQSTAAHRRPGSTESAQQTKQTDNHKQKQKKQRFHHAWNQTRQTVRAHVRGQNPWKDFFSLLKQFFMDPVYLASHPGRLGAVTAVVLSLVQGLIISIAVLLATGFAGRGLIRIFTNLIGLHGISGWRSIGTMAVFGIGGAVVYTAGIALLSFLLYAVGRWILRRAVSFWDAASAVAVCGIPMMLIGIFGIVFTIFSAPILALLLFCGFLLEFVLLYEAIQSVWGTSPTKTLYITGLVLFLFLCVCYNIIRLFML